MVQQPRFARACSRASALVIVDDAMMSGMNSIRNGTEVVFGFVLVAPGGGVQSEPERCETEPQWSGMATSEGPVTCCSP